MLFRSSLSSVFNTFGALAVAASIFGLEAALILRIGTNVFASLYSLLFNTVFQKVAAWFVKFSDDRDVLKGTV